MDLSREDTVYIKDVLIGYKNQLKEKVESGTDNFDKAKRIVSEVGRLECIIKDII